MCASAQGCEHKSQCCPYERITLNEQACSLSLQEKIPDHGAFVLARNEGILELTQFPAFL